MDEAQASRNVSSLEVTSKMTSLPETPLPEKWTAKSFKNNIGFVQRVLEN